MRREEGRKGSRRDKGDLSFADLGLAEPLLRALSARNHSTPTPIQAQAIPPLLEGRDMLGIAQTGTGKTGAFALPILHRLAQPHARGEAPNNRALRSPRALILAPTRELAIQIGDEIAAYGKGQKVRHAVIFGGVKQGGQVKALSRGVEVLVATPGRLLDLMNQGHAGLGAVEVLVLDEADRMLDMGFVRDVRKIVAAVPAGRQSLLFSATMPGEIAKLAGELLNEPVRVEVAPQSTTVERIAQTVRHVDGQGKRALMEEVMADPELKKVIAFTRTKHRANRVAEQLCQAGIEAEAIHGNKSQGARQRALKRFRSGDARVLVATDIAARGIDVDGVTHVVNYELPNEPESYVHRIGRTARAGADGAAISFCDPSERSYLRDIERTIRMRLTVIGEGPEGPEEVPEDKLRGRSRGGRRGGGRSMGQGAGRKPGQGAGRKANPNRKPASGEGKPRSAEGKPRSAEGKPGGGAGMKRRRRARPGGKPAGQGDSARSGARAN